MEHYRAYINRNNDEYEVNAKIFAEGAYETGYESDTGYYLDIISNPIWENLICFDEYGMEVKLTSGELIKAEEKLNIEYWDSILT